MPGYEGRALPAPHYMGPSQEEEIVRLTSRVRVLESVLADREAELLAAKGTCRAPGCQLWKAHSGPCHIKKVEDGTGEG